MKRLRLIFMSVLFGVCSHAMAEPEYYAMRVTMTDGKTFSFVVTDQIKVLVDEENTLIYGSSASSNLKTSMVQNYVFIDAATGIEEVMDDDGKTDDLQVKYLDGKTVQIRGRDAGVDVRVYSTDGRLQSPEISVVPGGLDVSLELLPKGTYIINIGNEKSIKVQKQ